MELTGTTVLVTGANRGLGRELVAALLDRGVRRVYAAARGVRALPELGERVVAVALDLTDRDRITTVAEQASDVTVLINNASAAAFADPFTADRAALELEMTTNYLGSLDVVRAFAPVIERNGGGAIVNVLSVVALAGHPPMAGYAASKAAAHSMTQAIRPGLEARGITVHGVYPAGIDTDMIADVEGPRTPADQVADGILTGLENGEEDIFPDPVSRSLSPTWFSDPKAYERAFSGR
jgi:NAD(P)-dependent dehydrogenase (short-subunit alcohol dehydrogenase family)